MGKFYKYSLLLVLATITLISCGKYNKTLNRGSAIERYELANTLYQKGEYDKSIRLYELIVPSYTGKKESEVVIYRLAEANYNVEDYTTAIYYYEKFLRGFPKSTEIENAQFKVAESYFELSPKYSVSQTDTRQALESYQEFIDNNPDSEKIGEANQKVNTLNLKLEKKAFEIAKQYFKIGNYKSAIVAFDNVILDFLGTSYKEEAMFYKFRSAFELAINSISTKKEERQRKALKAFSRYKKAFPLSKYLKDAEGLHKKLLKGSQTKQENS